MGFTARNRCYKPHRPMPMVRFVLPFLAAAAVPWCALSCAASPAAGRAVQIHRIEHWLKDSESANASRVAAAKRHLATLGTSSLPAIEQLFHKAKSTRMKTMLGTLLERLSVRRATQPAFVSLNLTNSSLRTAVRTLCSQAGIPHIWLKTNPAKMPAVTLHVTHVPFWQAMEDILHQSGWTMDFASEKQGHAIEISPSGGTLWPAEPYYVCGRYLIAVKNLNYNSNFTPAKAQPNGFSVNNIDMNVSIYNQPVGPESPASSSITLKTAMDNKGNNLINNPFANLPGNLPANMANQLIQFNSTQTYSSDHGARSSADLNLNVPKKMGTFMKLVKGIIYWNLPVGRQRLHIQNLQRQSSRSAVFDGFDIEFGRPVYHASIQSYTVAMILQTRQFMGAKPHTLSSGQIAVLNALQNPAGLLATGKNGYHFAVQINNGGGFNSGGSSFDDNYPSTSLTCMIRLNSPAKAAQLASPGGPSTPASQPAAIGRKSALPVAPPPAPHQLIWSLPVFQSRVTIPFKFGNIPLPPTQ